MNTRTIALVLGSCSLGFAGPQSREPAEQGPEWTQAALESLSGQIQQDIEKLRGEKFLRPVEVRLATKKGLIDYARARYEKTESPAKLAADERIAKLLGVFPADQDLLDTQMEFLEAQVAGFYDPDSDSFSLMDSVPKDLARIVLAHELVHALDDQLFGIDATLERLGQDTDRVLAFQAVVEGSATAVMNQWTMENMRSLSPEALTESQSMQLDSLALAPAWLWKPTFAVYMQGTAFLANSESWQSAAMARVPSADIRKAFEAPPRSTEQVLHPAKYWNGEQLEEPRPLSFQIGELPSGWTLLREDSLGELAIAIVASPASERGGLELGGDLGKLFGVRFGNEAAKGWGADRLVLLVDGDGHVLHWVTRWDSERDAAEFFGAISMRTAELLEAARVVSGAERASDCDVDLEYGDGEHEVVLTIRAGVKSSGARRALRAIEIVR